MVNRLKLFQKKNNGKLPERVLVYRDGVSEVCLVSPFVSTFSSFAGPIQYRQNRGTTSDLQGLPGLQHPQGTIQAQTHDHHLWQTPPYALLPH